MKKNETVRKRAEDLSDQGYGIVKADGKVIFVPDLLPGEEADIVIVHKGSRFSIGKVKNRYNDSPERTAPVCPKASSCGGCMLQHMDYGSQLQWKKKWMERLFKEQKVENVIASPDPFHYRNKAQIPVREGKWGFYKPHSNTIVEMEACAIQNPAINEIFQYIKENLKDTEGLRHLYLRSSEKTGAAMVVFIGTDNHYANFARELKIQFPEIAGILFNRNLRKDNVILGDETVVLEGTPWMPEDCLGLEVELDYRSFFQVNPRAMELLYAKALELADLKDTDAVIDLYSGTGTIGLLAAGKAGQVTGVEIVPEAVENARANAENNDIVNAEFILQDASEFARTYDGKADVLFVDPPRKGLTQQGIADIVRIRPERIIYISCNPQTLKRDLERFKEQGYVSEVVWPVDMFPQTAGVECVTKLVRQKSGLES